MHAPQNYTNNVTIKNKVNMLHNFSIMLYVCPTDFSSSLQLQIPLANFSQISEWQKFKDTEFIQLLWQQAAEEKRRNAISVVKYVKTPNLHKSTEKISLIPLFRELLILSAFIPSFQENLKVHKNQDDPNKNKYTVR